MNDPTIPNYPVVHVTVQPDGSAHVNAAGDHQNYPAADVDETRERVLAYAIAVATRLGRGVRMTTVDPDGEWKLGVYPDGEVVDLAPAPPKGRTAAKVSTSRPPAGAVIKGEPSAPSKESPTVVLERTTDRTVIAPRAPRQPHQPGTPVATLKFSTGETAIIGPPAIIGRNPSALAADVAGAQLIVVSDRSRTVSRMHADVAWVGGKLTVSDRGAGNGTSITRPSTGQFDLTPGKPYELLDGDLLHIGPDVACAVAISYLQGETAQ
ncbi:FHA domain-containing protein [Lacisediminihabitans sp.]|uniref:FHA domain-containing protein n=1 Tax=Lacisediminihabitans sp. TaxID=2787631 RepID=UPI00374DECBE